MPRVFVAIDLQDATKRSLAPLREQEWVEGPLRWVAPESLHLTLKFLGEIEGLAAVRVTSALSDASFDIEPFELCLRGTGVFPNRKNPRVFWVGIEDEPRLFSLVDTIEETLEPLGFRRERRRFHPHITMARIRGSVRGFASEVRETEPTFSVQPVSSFVVKQSLLQRGGARYLTLATIPLR